MSDTKKIDYEDILATMNLIVENGQLRIIRGNPNENTLPKKIDLNKKPEPTAEEIEEERRRDEVEKKEEEKKRIEQRRIILGLENARSRNMKFINNYPEQIVQDIPQRTTTIFPMKR